MKLRTEMRRSVTMTVPMGNDDELMHDAAAAHALMQAMADVDIEDFESFSSTCVTRIMERASELMREWGLDSGEVDGHE